MSRTIQRTVTLLALTAVMVVTTASIALACIPYPGSWIGMVGRAGDSVIRTADSTVNCTTSDAC